MNSMSFKASTEKYPELRNELDILTRDLTITNRRIQNMEEELSEIKTMLTTIIRKSTMDWSKPMTNEEILMISKYLK